MKYKSKHDSTKDSYIAIISIIQVSICANGSVISTIYS